MRDPLNHHLAVTCDHPTGDGVEHGDGAARAACGKRYTGECVAVAGTTFRHFLCLSTVRRECESKHCSDCTVGFIVILAVRRSFGILVI